MCGILCILGINIEDVENIKKLGLKNVKHLRHRGPDWGGMKVVLNYEVSRMNYNDKILNSYLNTHILFHERLGIVSPKSGAQPITVDGCSVTVNGEIYNHNELKNKYFEDREFKSGSDCEIIAHLFNHFVYHKYHTLNDIPSLLDGQFAFVAVKENEDSLLVARDPLGIAPLYFGFDYKNNLWISSELKAINKITTEPMEFPPGHCLISMDTTDIHNKNLQLFQYYNPAWLDGDLPEKWLFRHDNIEETKQNIKTVLTKAVKKRMMADVPFGLLLSGGLDSSLIASIVLKNIPREERYKIKTFSIGLSDSPDLIAAQKVANYLGTDHHSIVYSLDEGFYALDDIIYHLETYDITTIRAGTPMYLLARVIKGMGIKMVLSGEGADEALGGYLYFHKAPSGDEFFKETCRKLKDLHYYDVLRANKAPMAWGVEVRVPFLDKEFLELVMNIDPDLKKPLPKKEGDKPIEKYILRTSFQQGDYLPDDVLWRQKEQFSDGVGYSWIDYLKEKTKYTISDKEFEMRNKHFPYNTPQTKEGYYYRKLFSSHFPWNCEQLVPSNKTIACSSGIAAEWDEKWKGISEASGRIVDDIHLN